MMLDRENNEHSEDSASMKKSMMLSGERRKRTIFGSVTANIGWYVISILHDRPPCNIDITWP
jgi:hypothetical protein